MSLKELVGRDQVKNVITAMLGGCITTTSPGDVCALNSVAVECNGFRATRCECKQGFQSLDVLTCEGKTMLEC